MNSSKLNQIHNNVPVDYYEQGLQKSFLQKYFHSKRFSHISRILSPLKINNFLDLGCHSGIFTDKIKKITKANGFGMDISEKVIQHAKNQHPDLNFLCGDIQNGLPFPDQNFDLVTTLDVLEHLPNYNCAVSESARVLKPGGYLLVGIPNENLLFKFVWFFWTKMRGKYWNEAHVSKFRSKNLKGILEPSGFKKIADAKIHCRIYYIGLYRKSL
ncbi:class I SAM-dependent methyltransferase [Patescibacteria group bacterium]|nr:class I SAM-dependent methyltransferase [Patescibacteria group bacterium]MBU4512394.1 class I SAM-dependent methyltransferase [Patescibacteria group bacterium]MCG2692968.1 class I SAM-dependent methyltransferase [Candidatus Parcubacteria bacterium]